MTAYRLWTLTCEGCGQIFDNGSPYLLADVKADARRHGWRTGRTRHDDDLCDACDSIQAVETPEESAAIVDQNLRAMGSQGLETGRFRANLVTRRPDLRPDLHSLVTALEAMPDGTVVITRNGEAWQSARPGYWYRAYGDSNAVTAYEMAQIIGGPVKVLQSGWGS